MKHQKIFILVALVIVAVLLSLGVWIGVAAFHPGTDDGANQPSGYIAVYMATGDVYFGEPHWFPSLSLTNALYIQRSTDQAGRAQLGILPFSNVFWQPVGDIHLNSQQILFWAPIAKNSQVAQAIANPALLSQQVQPSSDQAGLPATATSTNSGKSK